jgi:hypothetical protein
MPVCASPATFSSWVGVCVTVIGTSAVAAPALARIRVVPAPTAVTIPSELTVATAGLLLVQLTLTSASGFPS